MTIYDISVPLRPGIPTYGGNEPGAVLEYTSLMSRGASSNLSSLSLGSHTGTHVDAPHHFIDGHATIDALSPVALLGPVHVVEHLGSGHVTAADITAASLPADARRVLIKTSNGAAWDRDTFHEGFIGLEPDGARALVDRGVVLVGIDYLSIERFHAPGHPVHMILLGAGVVIVEGLDLRAVSPGRYSMCCAPLNVVGAEGAPARVFLWDELPA